MNIQWLNYLRTFRRGFTTIALYYEPSVLRWSRVSGHLTSLPLAIDQVQGRKSDRET